MSAKIQLKRGTAADLYAINPVLLRGEAAIEIDTNKVKYGDGVTAWRDLAYSKVDATDGGEIPSVSGSVYTKIQLKRGLAADFYSANPVLLKGEPALETDTNKIKYGDGVTAWRDLPYGNPSLEIVDGGDISRPAPGTTIDFTPPNLQGLALWLDAADADFVSVVNNRVSEWSDKSVNKRHFFQSLKANRPINSNVLNDLNVVTFDGSNDAMLGSFELNPVYTLFVVLNARGASSDGRIFTALNHAVDTDSAGFIPCATQNGTKVGVRIGSSYFGEQEITTYLPAVYSLSLSADSFTTRLNGSNAVTEDSNVVGNFTRFAIGSSRSDYASGAFNGDVAEIVIYNRVLNDAERQQVEAYLMHRWGVVQVVHPLTNGMVAFWPLNEQNGNRSDSSGNEKTFVVGTGSASQTVDSDIGVIGRAAAFTGQNYLEADITDPVKSFSCWFNISSANAQKSLHQIIGQWKSGGSWILKIGRAHV